MGRRWLVLLLLSPCMAAAATAPPIDEVSAVFRQCQLQSNPDLHGLTNLAAACPTITAAVSQLQLDALLPADWRSRVDVFALIDLGGIAARYAGAAPTTKPDAARLRALAVSLAPKTASVSWWQRLLDWLQQRLQPGKSTWPAWLRFGWLWHWPPTSRFWVRAAEALAGVVLLTAIVVAALELFATIHPRSRLPRRLRRRSHAMPKAVDPAHGTAEIELATAAGQPVVALRLLVDALLHSRRLAHERNLTCRELVQAARFDDDTQRAEFGHLALLAERVLYGGSAGHAATDPKDGRTSDDAIRALHRALLKPWHPHAAP